MTGTERELENIEQPDIFVAGHESAEACAKQSVSSRFITTDGDGWSRKVACFGFL